MKEPQEKVEITDLEKADCLTGKMVGGIALKAPGWGSGKRRRFVFDDPAGEQTDVLEITFNHPKINTGSAQQDIPFVSRFK